MHILRMVPCPAEWGNEAEQSLHGVYLSMGACPTDKQYLGVVDTDVCYQ